MSRAECIAVVLVGTLWAVPGVSHAAPSWRLAAELGPEIDTNARRLTDAELEQEEADGLAPLMRLVVNASASLRRGRHRFDADYGGGGKLYLADAGRPADEIVQRTSLGWTVGLRGVNLGLKGSYYDAFLRREERDFRSGNVAARLALSRGRGLGLVRVGYQGLEFKPSAAFSFHGLLFGIGWHQLIVKDQEGDPIEWRVGISYLGALRRYGGDATILGPCSGAPEEDGCVYSVGTPRRDLSHNLRAELDYLGPAAFTLWYGIEHNSSNSYGESYTRHVIGIKFTTALVFGVYLTAKGVLQLSEFADPLFGMLSSETFASVEEENRSRLLVHLARDLGKGWALALRYGVYLNETGATSTGETLPGFLRHTLFLGLRFEIER